MPVKISSATARSSNQPWAAAANGWLDERATALEILTSIKRAGADLIITYHAADAARWLAE